MFIRERSKNSGHPRLLGTEKRLLILRESRVLYGCQDIVITSDQPSKLAAANTDAAHGICLAEAIIGGIGVVPELVRC